MADTVLTGNVGEGIPVESTAPESTSVATDESTLDATTEVTDTTAETKWYDGMSDDILTDKIKSFESPEALAKSYNEAEKLIGKKSVDFDKLDELDDDQRSKLWTGLGVPESEGDYKVESENMNEADVANFQGMSKDAGLTQEQSAKLLSSYEGYMVEGFNHEKEETTTSLKKEWGSEFESRMKNIGGIVQSMNLTETLNNTGMGNNLAVAKMLDTIATTMAQDTTRSDQTIGGGTNQIDSEIQTIRQSVEFSNAMHGNHHASVQKLNDLYARKAALAKR